MYQLAIDVIDTWIDTNLVEPLEPFRLQDFQPLFIFVFALLWVIVRQTIVFCSPKANPNRVVGLCHAVTTVLTGIPVLNLLCEKSTNYYAMFDSLTVNSISLSITSNLICYISVGYFLMDSYFLVRKSYLKHHVAAIATFMLSAYHHPTTLIHGVICISLFELGAILVQVSRLNSNNLFFRTLICMGYTATRLALCWYSGFIYVTTILHWPTESIPVKMGNFAIWGVYGFLLILNAKWTCMQWRALFAAYRARFSRSSAEKDGEDFFTFHQRIIGNTTPVCS